MQPICVPCKRFMRCVKNGHFWIEAMPKAGVEQAIPGDTHGFQWEPYKLWAGDLYECKGCGTQTIAGVPTNPVAEHYEAKFDEAVALLKPITQVNDC